MNNRLPSFTLPAGAIFLAASIFSASDALANPIQLLNWKPVPDTSPAPAEINYTGGALQTDVGAISNSDGNLAVQLQTPGGLQSETFLNAPAPYSYLSSAITGGTGYYDTTLVFAGLAPFGPTIQTPLPGGILLDAQVLGPGSFILFSTNVAPGPVILLQGNIDDAVITGINGGAAGAVIDSHGVTYTGGILLAAIPPAFGPVFTGNDMSITLTSVTPTFGVNGITGQLNAFNADATGEFDINVTNNVPEPAALTLGMLGLAGLALGYRGRKGF